MPCRVWTLRPAARSVGSASLLPRVTDAFLAASELAADSRLLLEAGRPRGAAALHAEAGALLLRAWLSLSGADTSISDPRSLPRTDTLTPRFRAVWLRPAQVPSEPELRAMADGLRSLIGIVRERAAPPLPPPPTLPADRRVVAPARPSPAAPPKDLASSNKPAAEVGPRRAARPMRPEAALALGPAPAVTPTSRSLPTPTPKPKPAPTRAPGPGSSRPETPRAKLPAPASPPPPRKPVSSAAFWSLIDRWVVGDHDALALIGHEGGLTKRGTRPRFRLTGTELDRFHLLQTLDDALAGLDQEVRAWLEVSRNGRTRLAAMLAGGEATVREETRLLLGEGLRRSLR